MNESKPIKKRDALRCMRELSEVNIPFALGFFRCSTTMNSSEGGYKVVRKAILRRGYRDNQSNKSDVLIAYIDYDDRATDKNRHFYYPLLMMFNGQKVIP
ncbi:hypothetical protein [Flavicella sp.]|uniref:hypothetical protein n=1 Tax=Flavicella sp. TaxID=2957742 RepID=UPI003019191F